MKLKKRHKKYLKEWTDNMIECEADEVSRVKESSDYKIAKQRLKVAKELAKMLGS